MNTYLLDRARLQRYMAQLRGCAGLSAEALGAKIGLTKQAISHIENHPEKPITKMQYVCIRAIFEEEYCKNPDNINLRDCYDLVFSEPEFYEENRDRIEYAIYQAVEDTKKQKKITRTEAKKAGKPSAPIVAGATATTVGIGGIAALTFPLIFPLVGAAVGGMVIAKAMTKEKRKDNSNIDKRASSSIKHSKWMQDAFETIEE